MFAAAETGLPAVSLPMVQAYHPITFLERGVAVPFTTPALVGGRARPVSDARGGTEILVRNPSGGRGFYILPWDGVCSLCQPTVHDTILNQRLSALHSITPGSILRVAREIAAEGLAGREASTAAVAGADGERQDRLRANFLLLMRLLEQKAPSQMRALAETVAADTARDGAADGARDRARDGSADRAAIEKRARRILALIAPGLGLAPDAVASSLEELGEVFGSVGLEQQSPPARVRRLLDAICGLRDDMRNWSREQTDDSAGLAEMVATVADLTIACASRTLSDAHALTRDVPALLQQWRHNPQRLAVLVTRPEWLVDGWEEICLLWRYAAGTAAQRSAVAEMAALVPVLPREVSDWVGTQIDTELVSRFRRTVRLNQDWRTGISLERVAINEQLRAMAI